jgi:hypothetical protein
MVKDQQKQNIIISITNSIILFHYLEDDIMFATYSNSIKFTASDTLASLGNILLIKDEDGTFKGLKDKYKCLSMNNTNNLTDKVNQILLKINWLALDIQQHFNVKCISVPHLTVVSMANYPKIVVINVRYLT